MLVQAGEIPPDWRDWDKTCAKKEKVRKFMDYAIRVGALSASSASSCSNFSAKGGDVHDSTNTPLLESPDPSPSPSFFE